MLGRWQRLTDAQTAAAIFVLGALVALAGDATHVASGTTKYEWDPVTIWRSAFWFPLLVGGAILAAAIAGERFAGKPVNKRGRNDVITGAALILALYGLTAILRGQEETVSIVLIGALGVAIWAWWDPSPGALAIAAAAAVLGPLGEVLIIELDWAHYAKDSDGLLGVAPWLTGLYFGAGAVASRLWAAIARDGR